MLKLRLQPVQALMFHDTDQIMSKDTWHQ